MFFQMRHGVCLILPAIISGRKSDRRLTRHMWSQWRHSPLGLSVHVAAKSESVPGAEGGLAPEGLKGDLWGWWCGPFVKGGMKEDPCRFVALYLFAWALGKWLDYTISNHRKSTQSRACAASGDVCVCVCQCGCQKIWMRGFLKGAYLQTNYWLQEEYVYCG